MKQPTHYDEHDRKNITQATRNSALWGGVAAGAMGLAHALELEPGPWKDSALGTKLAVGFCAGFGASQGFHAAMMGIGNTVAHIIGQVFKGDDAEETAP